MISNLNISTPELPLVTIVALCYNQARFAEETLDSILAQTYPNIQLIIMDDTSTDNSVEVINNWIVKNKVDCVFIAHKENKGICKTLNEALELVRGEYYQAIACDDTLLPSKISIQINQFLSNKATCVAYSDAYIMNEYSEWEKYGPKMIQTNILVFKEFSKNIFTNLLEKNFIPAPSVLIKTQYVKEISGYDESLSFEDWDLWLRLAGKHEFIFNTEPLVVYRLHNNNLTKQLNNNIKHLESRFILLYKHIDNCVGKDYDILGSKLYTILKELFRIKHYNISKLSNLYYKKFNNDKVLKLCCLLPKHRTFIYQFMTKIK